MPLLVRARHRGDQRLGIGMQRMVEHVLGRTRFDDLAEVHHQHPVAQQPHDAEVMRHEQIAHAELDS